jgi:hypothetical protein
MRLLSEPFLDRPNIMLTSTLYEGAPAPVMAICHRLNQAGELIYHPAIRGYEIRTGRLMPEDFDVFMEWYAAEEERIKRESPFSRPPMKVKLIPAPASAPEPAPAPAPARPRARLSSDPPSPKIEV